MAEDDKISIDFRSETLKNALLVATDFFGIAFPNIAFSEALIYKCKNYFEMVHESKGIRSKISDFFKFEGKKTEKEISDMTIHDNDIGERTEMVKVDQWCIIIPVPYKFTALFHKKSRTIHRDRT